MKISPILSLCALFGSCLIATAADAAKDAPSKQPDRPIPPEMIKKFDKDGDGKLSDGERQAMKAAMDERRKEMIAKYDADGDGKLSEEEEKKAREAHKAEWLKRYDKDGDGKLSDAERAAMPKRPEGGPGHAPGAGGPGHRPGAGAPGGGSAPAKPPVE